MHLASVYRQEQLVDALCSGDHVSFTHVCSRMPQYGRTALMAAAEEGHDATAKMLIDGGADVNLKDQVRVAEWPPSSRLYWCERHVQNYGCYLNAASGRIPQT